MKNLILGPFIELNKVTWPTYRQTLKNAWAVILFIGILVGFYFLVTSLWTAIMRIIEAGA